MMMPSSPANVAPIKPYCRAIKRGSLGSDIDGRSREGKFLRRIETELVDQLGGAPTFSQRLAVRRIARLMLQAESFDTKMSSGNWTPHDARTAGGINNAVLKALKDLGLKGRADAKSLTPSIADIAARHSSAGART